MISSAALKAVKGPTSNYKAIYDSHKRVNDGPSREVIFLLPEGKPRRHDDDILTCLKGANCDNMVADDPMDLVDGWCAKTRRRRHQDHGHQGHQDHGHQGSPPHLFLEDLFYVKFKAKSHILDSSLPSFDSAL